ncbi:type I-E CRISPR-associated protein Cse2/CasB [Kitasatospora sp. NPDC059646]|uniref:type I-E CRISPR-associated protein Cse2/CasB n=1 Tax=Kitasatospora sp. NPDC059646 TaxID=3346893 RepID=UPI0036B4CEAB
MTDVIDADTEALSAEDVCAGGSEGPPKWIAYEVGYMEAVARACGTPAGRARLRRVLSSAGMVSGWELPVPVARLVPRNSEGRLAYGAVAGMFAAQSPSVSAGRKEAGPDAAGVWRPGRGNLGWTLRMAVLSGVLHEDSAQERLQRLARLSDLGALVVQCRPLVARVAGEGVPLNWPLLLRDVRRWPERRVEVANDWFFSFAHGVAPDGDGSGEGSGPGGDAGAVPAGGMDDFDFEEAF